MRRFRDLHAQFVSDLGGADAASHAELAIARRASCLIVELEQLEMKFAQAGHAEPWQLELYGRTASTMRRLCEAIGLQRRQRDVLQLHSQG